MIGYTPEAERQVDALRAHYENKGRLEASRNLDAALDEAERRIEMEPEMGLRAPRPYPDLARPGQSWIKAKAYWVVYSRLQAPVILGVFYAESDIPGRF